MFWRRIFGLVLGFSLLATLFSTSPAPIVQAHNPAAQSITITSCDGLKEKLNEVHEHNIAAVNNCEWSATGWVGGGGHITGESVIEFNVFRAPLDPYSGQPVGWETLPPAMWLANASGGAPNNIITNILVPTNNFPCQFSPNSTPDGYNIFNWPCSSEKTYTGMVDVNSHYGIYDFKVRSWAYFSTVNPAPTVEISADPPIIFPGQNTTLRWNSTNATSLSIDNGVGSVAMPSGEKVVGPINVDTTYTISATGNYLGAPVTASVTIKTNCSVGAAPDTKKVGFWQKIRNRFGPPPALAQNSQCLPDLTVDLSQAKTVIEDTLGKTRTESLSRLSNTGYETKTITITGVAIKNAGLAPAKGKVIVVADYANEEEYHNNPCYQFDLDLDLAPGQSTSINFTPYKTADDGSSDGCWPAGQIDTANHSGLFVKIDHAGQITESDEENNLAWADNVFGWPSLSIRFLPDVPRGLALVLATTDVEPEAEEIWNYEAYPFQVYSLNQGSRTYATKVDVDDNSFPGPKVTVSENRRYDVTVTTKDGLLIVQPEIILANDRHEKVDELKVTLIGKDRQGTVTKESTGAAVFRVGAGAEIKPGQYDLQMRASLIWGKDDANGNYTETGRANFAFPQAYSGGSGNKFATAVTGETKIEKYKLTTDTQCVDEQSVTYCFQDTPERIAALKAAPVMARIKAEIHRMKSWLSYPVNLKEVNLVLNPFSGYAGKYEPDKSRTRVTLESHYLTDENATEAANTVIHEMFHVLDDAAQIDTNPKEAAYLTGESDEYFDLLVDQFSEPSSGAARDTGMKLWDLALYNCAYAPPGCNAGYDSSGIVDFVGQRAIIADIEAFAEEKSTVCTYKNRVTERLNNIQAVWQEKVGTPPPADLIPLRDIVIKRLTLLEKPDGRIGAWHSQCLGVGGGGGNAN